MKRLFKKQVNKKRDKKRLFIIALVSAFFLCLAIFGIINYRQGLASTQCRSQPTSPLYEESVDLVNRSLLVSSDGEVVEKIENDKGYRKDINCLYPLIKYYIHTKNDQKVEELFGLFEEYYGDDKQVQKIYKDYDVDTYEDVKLRVDRYINGEGSSDVIFF